MSDVLLMLLVFAASFSVGYFLIVRAPPRLHTPLMSMTNAISGVTILGALLLFTADLSRAEQVFGLLAVAMAVFNLVGGFAITDRMLKLFRKRSNP